MSTKYKKKPQKNEALNGDLRPLNQAGQVFIPSENILFIGGQENFINKLKKQYPGWTYLNMSERNCGKVNGRYDLAIIKADHCSHNIIEHALAHCGDVPVIYSNCTNMQRMLSEVSDSYIRLTLGRAG